MNIKIGNRDLCPNAYNVHGFGAVTASMVQDACGGFPHSLLQLRQVEAEAIMMYIRADRSSSS